MYGALVALALVIYICYAVHAWRTLPQVHEDQWGVAAMVEAEREVRRDAIIEFVVVSAIVVGFIIFGGIVNAHV